MSILDVFSQYHWLAPLTSKHATKVAIELKKIYDVHGTPENLLSDRGKRFYGAVNIFCERKKIKMTKSRAYHLQSQGKVERSHRTLRKKINYDLVKQGRKGVNWVKNLLEYPKCLNNDKCEELGWKSDFEVYYRRESNELVKCGLPVNRGKEFNVQKLMQLSENLIYERQKRVYEEREKAKNAYKKVCDRTVEYYQKRRQCSKYKKGEELFIRYRKKNRKKAPKQRFILGEVIKVGKNKDMYKIKFTSLISQVSKSE